MSLSFVALLWTFPIPPTHAHIHKYWIRSRFVQFSKDLRIAMIITLDHQMQVNATKA